MTSELRPALTALVLAAALGGLCASGARAAETAYPFEGTWVRANRACTPAAPLARTYTQREITTPTSHCAIRKIATGSGQFEIFEECRRAERQGDFTETIRMLGPDAMVVRRQAARLKIPRPLRYIRCSIAAPSAAKPSPHHPSAGEAAEHPAEQHPAAPKPAETPKP